MNKLLITLTLAALTVASLNGQVIFSENFDGAVSTYDSPNDGGAALVQDGSQPFSPVYYDGNDANVAPGIWQYSGANFVGDLTLNQNSAKARATTVVLAGSFSGLYTVSFDLTQLNANDTLYFGVYDAFNSTGDMTNAYGYDVLANVNPGAPTVTTAAETVVAEVPVSAWASSSSGQWGPMQLGTASVTELALFSVGGAADNSGVLGVQSFNFTAGANDIMLFIGVASSADDGVRGTIDNLTITTVPEPSTFAFLAGLGALGIVLYRRRR